MKPPLIDLRPAQEFQAAHLPGCVGIPLEELADRVHELPSRETPICVADVDPKRAHQAAELLAARGANVQVVILDPAQLTEQGPSVVRLWQPTPFLVEALERIGTVNDHRALDVACGTGRDAVYLATQGCHVEAIDVLPDALQKADQLARRWGVKIQARVQDLEREPRLAAGQYDLVIVFRYLQRSLFQPLRAAVTGGGYIVYETFHELNRQTGRRPQSSSHLLRSKELAQAFAGFEILIARDGYERDGRYFSCLLARKPAE